MACNETEDADLQTRYYIVESEEIGNRAKDYLIAKINTQRAHENGVPFKVFKTYSEKNADMYIELCKAIDCMPGFVRTCKGRMRHIRVERFNFRVVLQVPVGLTPDPTGLTKISADVYQTMRQHAMAAGFGMPDLKPRKLSYTAM